MKKFLSIFLVVILLLSLSVSLFACDADEIKNLTYQNAAGETVKVSVKKTDDPEKVSQAILALASKEEDVAALEQLMATFSASVAVAGTANETPFDYSAEGTIKLGVAVPKDKNQKVDKFLKASKAYVYVNATGKIPDGIMAYMDDEDAKIDFSKTMNINEKGEIFFDENNLYTKLTLSEDTTAAAANLISNIADVNGKVGKIELATMIDTAMKLPKVSAELEKINLGEIFSKNNSWRKGVENGIEAADKDDDDDEEPAQYTVDQNVQNIVKAFHIKITKTKGSKVTFTAEFNNDTLTQLKAFYGDDAVEDFEAFEGSVYATLEIDAKTMLDMTLTLTVSDFVKQAFNEMAIEGNNITKTTATFTIALSTKEAIPTLTAAEKEGAVAINADFIGNLVQKLIKS